MVSCVRQYNLLSNRLLLCLQTPPLCNIYLLKIQWPSLGLITGRAYDSIALPPASHQLTPMINCNPSCNCMQAYNHITYLIMLVFPVEIMYPLQVAVVGSPSIKCIQQCRLMYPLQVAVVFSNLLKAPQHFLVFTRDEQQR